MDENLLLPLTNPPSRSDAVQNRALLLQTAQRLFAEFGVEEVSMSQLAREANVGKGTLYRHFQNKVELCQALLDQSQRELQERTFSYLRSDDTPYDKLLWFLTEVVQYVWDHGHLLCVNAGVFGAALLAHPAHFWWRETILALLRQMDYRDTYLADILYVMVDAGTIKFQRNTLGYGKEQILAGLHHTTLRMLR